MELRVTVHHDITEGVWFVASSDIPGLNAEAPTYDSLVEAIVDLAPELIAANMPSAGGEGSKAFRLCVQQLIDGRHADAA
jgi:hypothetical protein